jgi:hypothetical protein
MKKEARLLLNKAIDSLILSVEHFNRPYERGRVSSTLILLDHAFEMILKSAIIHRGGNIREKRSSHTIGFDACVRKAFSDDKIKFLSEEQTLQLQAVNGLRDAAQHHLLDISEQHFYLHAQGGLTLFSDIYRDVFQKELKDQLPDRVLPISTTPPCDLLCIFDRDVEEIRQLLKSGTRRKVEATAKLRSLAIVDGAIAGKRLQPGAGELKKLTQKIASGDKWDDIFPGVALINLSAGADGVPLNLRITKKEGVPVHLVPEGTEGSTVIAIRRVDELSFYSLGHKQVAEKVGLSAPKTSALVWHNRLQENPEYYKEIRIGRSRFGRYSQKAVDALKEALKQSDMDEIWREYQERG